MNRLKILLVDDHEDTLHAFSRLLRLQGWEVGAAQGVKAAIHLASEQHFDVLLCDLGLPDGDGCDVLRGIRARYPIKGIAVTGFGSEEDIARGERAGFMMHITKPCPLAPLVSILHEIEESRRAEVACAANGT